MDRDELKKVQLAIHDLVNREEYSAALPLINEVLENYPDDDATLNFMGYIHLMGDQPALAYQYFRRALQESPGNKALWTSLGRAYHELDMFEDAIKCFLKSAEIDNSYALAYSNAAASFVQQSEWKNAEEVCNLALETNPDDQNAQMNLAHTYLAQGKWEDGWKQWGKSLNSKFRKEWHYGDESRWEGQAGKDIIILW
jgi:tetratricopeptide (TPR) repeat protein